MVNQMTISLFQSGPAVSSGSNIQATLGTFILQWRARHKAVLAERQLQAQLSTMSPTMLHDVGMGHVLVDGKNPWQNKAPIVGFTVPGGK